MAARLLGVVLADIIDAIDRILAATSGKSFVDFEADWLLSLATLRALEIISEASRHILDERLERFPNSLEAHSRDRQHSAPRLPQDRRRGDLGRRHR